MNLRNRIVLLLLPCLSLPVPAYAMIELLPAFVAISSLLLILVIVPFTALLKCWLLRLRFRSKIRVPWKRLWIVSTIEAIIIASAIFMCFLSMESMLVPDAGPAILIAIFACAIVLYSLIAVIPNMWLLSRVQAESLADSDAHRPQAFAWLLSLPFPFLLLLEVLAVSALAL